MSKLPFLSRAAFARITTPIARGLLRVGLTPDVVTILGTTASVAGALTLFPMGKLFAGACVVWFFVLFDMLDGAMARERGGGTRFGAVLDATCDRISDGAVFCGLLWWIAFHMRDRPLVIATLICLVTGEVVRQLRRSGGHQPNGPGGSGRPVAPPWRRRGGNRSRRAAVGHDRAMITEDAFPVEPWQVRETKLNLNLLAQSESLFALSNGHIGLRGNLDEGEPFGLPGTYLNSFYEIRPLPYAEAGYGYPEPARPLSTSPTARSFACWSATSRSTSGMAN